MAHELPTPDTLAYTMSEEVADTVGGDGAQEYLVRFVDELLTLEPGLREHFTDLVLTELCEEITRCEDSRYAHATIELINQIQEKWRQDA